MNSIKFIYNLNNKLFCHCFSTIRLYDEKYKLEGRYDILYGNDKYDCFLLGSACLVYISVIKNIEEITNGMAYMDCAYNRNETINLLKELYSHKNINWDTQELLFLVFRWNNRPNLHKYLKPELFLNHD